MQVRRCARVACMHALVRACQEGGPAKKPGWATLSTECRSPHNRIVKDECPWKPVKQHVRARKKMDGMNDDGWTDGWMEGRIDGWMSFLNVYVHVFMAWHGVWD